MSFLIRKVLLGFLLLFFISVIITSAALYFNIYKIEQNNRETAILAQIDTSNSLIANALWKFDFDYLDVAMARLLDNPYVSAARLTETNKDKVIYESPNYLEIDLTTAIRYQATIYYQSPASRTDLATIEIYSNADIFYQHLFDSFSSIMLFALLSLIILSIGLIWLIQHLVVRPIQYLALEVEHYNIDHPEYFTPPEYLRKRQDEISSVILSFSRLSNALETRDAELSAYHLDLEHQVELRTAELSKSNSDMAQIIKQLRETQHELVEAEKMASLGTLIAGVAHEINTPIGVSITSTSALKDQLNALQNAYLNSELDEAHLEEFVGFAFESIQISQKSLSSASSLIASFKQLEIDREKLESNNINVKHLLNQQVLAARNNSIAAKKQIEFTVECSELLFIESYDSILSEVISNLLRNAIAHAFEASNKNQQILLKAHAIKESIMILVIDNGKGIESTLQDKIFQPFVTSRRIDGFSGLGLHLVFNLVTQLLMGRIDLSSEINHGSTFTLTLPSNVHKKQLHNLN